MTPKQRLTAACGRFPADTIQRLEEVVAAIQGTAPGVQVSMSDALRACVDAGLPEVERRLGIGEPAK